jgi:hypothetical protein
MNMSANNYNDWSIQIEGKLKWEEIFNSNHFDYWGTGTHLNKMVPFKEINVKNKIGEINISIPALSIQVFR